MLKNVQLQNFRVLSNLMAENLARVNLFTGRNNSGKTDSARSHLVDTVIRMSHCRTADQRFPWP